MSTNCAKVGEEYYKLVGAKDVEGVKRHLHPEVELVSPLVQAKGLEGVLKATGSFMQAVQSLRIRSVFGSNDQAMIVYNIDVPHIATDFPGASLLTFRNGLISRIELFYDSRRFVEKKEEIFSK